MKVSLTTLMGGTKRVSRKGNLPKVLNTTKWLRKDSNIRMSCSANSFKGNCPGY